MNIYLAIGSNLKQDNKTPRDFLIHALDALNASESITIKSVSPLYHTPPLLTPDAPEHWYIPYLNGVIEIETSLTPQELLVCTQKIEQTMGRIKEGKYSPRIIDLDLLCEKGKTTPIKTDRLTFPHPEMLNRAFVLDPLKDIAPMLALSDESCVSRAAKHPEHQPLVMGILNLTPDSFSDGGTLNNKDTFVATLDTYEHDNVQIIDLGAESTRPDATLLTHEEEWARLEPYIALFKKRYEDQYFSPRLSIDTYHTKTAQKALEQGANIINDVSGAKDPALIELLSAYPETDYVLTHSLDVPVIRENTIPPEEDPALFVQHWFETELDKLDKQGISSARIILDPGIGFGKTALQSLELLKHMGQFRKHNCRILAGYSRKSFMNLFTNEPFATRDPESLAVTLHFMQNGHADIVRVHNATIHARALRAASHLK